MNSKGCLERIKKSYNSLIAMTGIDKLELNDDKCFDVIMKDLEVLEILKTKRVDLCFINDLINFYSLDKPQTDEDKKRYALDAYNDYDDYNTETNNLSYEEFDKIIRWSKKC